MLPTLAIRAFNIIGKPFGINPFPRAFTNVVTEAATDRRSAFDRIYKGVGWPAAESRSGVGSDSKRTATYLGQLDRCLDELKVSTLFDAPCGDLNWIGPVAAKRGYIGGDVSAALIDDLHRSHPQIDTRLFDICDSEFPAADLWHCRDCLFHLPIADIRLAFENFARSSIPYALLTTHRSRWLHRNLDVPIGGFRYLDLQKAPFNLPAPIRALLDYRPMIDFPRFMGLWQREQIVAALAAWR